MLNKLKSFFSKPEPPAPEKPKASAKRERKPKQKKPELSEKDKATEAGEPYISIVRVDVDPANINSGSFELDWNDKFVINLIKSGYKQREDDTDQIIVDRWFQTVCRNIALELYEQQEADPDLRRVYKRDLGNGRTEVS